MGLTQPLQNPLKRHGLAVLTPPPILPQVSRGLGPPSQLQPPYQFSLTNTLFQPNAPDILSDVNFVLFNLLAFHVLPPKKEPKLVLLL